MSSGPFRASPSGRLRRKLALALAIPMRARRRLRRAPGADRAGAGRQLPRHRQPGHGAADRRSPTWPPPSNAAVVARERTARRGPRATPPIAGGGRRRRRQLESAARHRRPDAGPARAGRHGARPEQPAAQRRRATSASASRSPRSASSTAASPQLITTIVDGADRARAARSSCSTQTLDGRLSLAMQQLAVAYGTGDRRQPASSCPPRSASRPPPSTVSASRSAPPTRRVLAAAPAERARTSAPSATGRHRPGRRGRPTRRYDSLTADLLTGIDTELTSAASEARNLAIVNSAVTVRRPAGRDPPGAADLALLLNPIRRVREGALHVAHEELPEDGRRDPGRRGPRRDHADRRDQPRGDGPAGPGRRRPAPAGRPPGLRRGRAALARSATCSSPCRAATPR